MTLEPEDLAAIREALTPPGSAPIPENDLAVIAALLVEVAILFHTPNAAHRPTATTIPIRKRG